MACIKRTPDNTFNFVRMTRATGATLADLPITDYCTIDLVPPLPDGVVDLVATTTPATGTTIVLTWTDLPNTLSYNIYRSTSPNVEPIPANYLDNVLVGVETYSDESLAVDTYYYILVGLNIYGLGDTSNEDSATIFDIFNIAADNANNDNAYIPQV